MPNIKRVETLSITEIARELARLAELARGNKLPPQDLAGGSITLSNIGAIGGTYMSPVLVPGEAVIGAIGAVQKVPRYAPDGSLQPQMVMQVGSPAACVEACVCVYTYIHVFAGQLGRRPPAAWRGGGGALFESVQGAGRGPGDDARRAAMMR